jgi:biofilm PGA synthesis N-glycosyltransferase PgaC
MRILFWSSLALIFLAYAGYPIYLYVRARFWPRPIRRGSILPAVSLVLAVHNEDKHLPAKLQNLAELDYPADLVQIIVVSDGSTDCTNGILERWQHSPAHTAVFADHRGKAAAINRGLDTVQGQIVVFTDARQTLAVDALRQLVADFADPSVGCVSGELMIGQDPAKAAAQGAGLYWRLEKKMRYWEGLAGSGIGATGALYAVRRELLVALPEGTILDDVYIPVHVPRQGQRVVFEPQALAFDPFTPDPRQEFRRKLRTLFGNYQLLRLAPWILTRPNPLRASFVCHKLLRLLVPFALIGTVVSAFCLRAASLYETALVLQLLFYALAALKLFHAKFGVVSRLADISLAFIVLNTAAAVAFVYFVTGKKALWAGI